LLLQPWKIRSQRPNKTVDIRRLSIEVNFNLTKFVFESINIFDILDNSLSLFPVVSGFIRLRAVFHLIKGIQKLVNLRWKLFQEIFEVSHIFIDLINQGLNLSLDTFLGITLVDEIPKLLDLLIKLLFDTLDLLVKVLSFLKLFIKGCKKTINLLWCELVWVGLDIIKKPLRFISSLFKILKLLISIFQFSFKSQCLRFNVSKLFGKFRVLTALFSFCIIQESFKLG